MQGIDWFEWCNLYDLAIDNVRNYQDSLGGAETYNATPNLEENLHDCYISLERICKEGYYHFDKNKVNDYMANRGRK